jgi:subtilisin family serine protease
MRLLVFVRALAISVVLALGLLASGVPATGQQSSAGATYVPGEVLVRFAAGMSMPRRDAALTAIGARVIRRFNRVGIHHARIAPGQSVEGAVAALTLDPDVLDAQPNYIRRIDAPAPPNDPFWVNDNMWGLARIQAQNAWSGITTGSRNVVIADIDTGVNYTHPDLAVNMWRNPGEIPGNGIDDDGNGYVDDVYGIDARNHDSDPMDDNGHGTHTSGTLGAAGNNGIGVVGVNWNTSILSCKFLGADGSGTDAGAIECFNYVVALKNRGINIRVTNNSWGAPRGQGPIAQSLKAAFDAAGAAGILNVAAAGNSGVNTDNAPFDPASFVSPSIVSVANSDINDNRASSSNWGPVSVDLAAPGSGIVSTYGSGYASATGTSMAAPHVAGSAALLIAQQPSLSVSAVKSLLLGNVDLVGPWPGLVASGGRLNVYRAALANTTNAAPSVALTQPPDGSTFTAPASVPIEATASDSDGTIARVDFYANGNSIGSVAAPPYSITWSGVSAGTYALTATATDNGGATASSGARTIVVSSGGGGGGGGATSPDGTRLPPASQIVDNTGAVWTLSGLSVLRNGQQTGGLGTILTWCGGLIYTFGVDSQWWRWNGGWSPVGTTDPCGSAPPPPPPGTSPDGTRVPPASQIVDNTGAVWTRSGLSVLRNGQQTGGLGTIITWCAGQIHTFGVDNQWWRWTGGGWTPVGTIDPCGSQ